MEVKKGTTKIDSHPGWRAYWWETNKSDDMSVCVIEIDPGKSLDHKHLLPDAFETEVVLEGQATYLGEDLELVLNEGEYLDQRGTSGLIKLQNKGKGKLKILCLNRPPWREEHEEILNK